MNTMRGVILLAAALTAIAATAMAQVSSGDKARCELLREEIARLRKKMSPDLIYLPPALVDRLENFKGMPSRPVSREQLGELVREMQMKAGWTADDTREFMADTIRYNLKARRATQKHLVELNAELLRLETGSSAPLPGPGKPQTPPQPEPPPQPADAGQDDKPAFSIGDAERMIVGDWLFTVGGKDNRVYVTFVDDDPANPKFRGILMLDNLRHFNQGDVIFEVKHVPDSPGTFRGTEMGYDDEGVRRDESLTLQIQGGTMKYAVPGQALTLTRGTER